ncbi:MAG: DUF4097 family beta strand repeat-containing protein [Phycisphaerae bacterium]|nr:DUF4097 family beta strand repeat-containing protein [Phycisphaerae bacterium]
MNRKILIILLMPVLILISGCIAIAKVKYTRQVNVTVPAGQAETFVAETHNGNITIKGSETTDCNLAAVIAVKAGTEEAAKTIAEEIKISLLPEGNSIIVKIEKPDIPRGVQINIDLDTNLPAKMNLSLASHNGNITTTDTSGSVKASTHNGNIGHKGTLADLKFESHNGNIAIHCIGQSAKPCEINAETHNGNIDFTAPENFSAAIDASTHNGSIQTSLPVAVSGKIGKNLKGTLGDGRDKLYLKTHNGSIKIK